MRSSNRRASGSSATGSRNPPTCVRPVIRRARPIVRPRSTNNPANVTLKKGRPVRVTIGPFGQPTATAAVKAKKMHRHDGQPLSAAGTTMRTPAKPIIEPNERWNSPPIMSRTAATATIPSCADTSRKVTTPKAEKMPVPRAATAKNRNTDMQSTTAPSSGRAISRRASGTRTMRSSLRIAPIVAIPAPGRLRSARGSRPGPNPAPARLVSGSPSSRDRSPGRHLLSRRSPGRSSPLRPEAGHSGH